MGEYAAINIQGVDRSTFIAQAELLRESLRELQRSIAQDLLPILATAARRTRSFIDFIGGESPASVGRLVTALGAATLAYIALRTAVIFANNHFVSFTQLVPITASFQQRLAFEAANATTAIRAQAVAIAASRLAMTLWIGALTVGATALTAWRIQAAIAANSATDLQRAFAQGADAFRFDTQLGRVRRFGDLTQAELRTLISGFQEARRIASAEIEEIAQRYGTLRNLNADQILQRNLDLAGVLGSSRERLDQLRISFEVAHGQTQ